MFQTVRALLILSFRQPRLAAQFILRLPLGESGRWTAFALMVVLSAVLMHLLSSVTPLAGPEGEMLDPPGPLFWAMTVAVGMGIMTGLTYGVGRMMGGRGRASDLAVLMAWLQFVQLVLAAAQLLLVLAVPLLGNLLELGALLAFLWLLTTFVAEAHGFRSTGMVGVGVAVVFVIMVVVLTILLYPYLSTGA